jgi:hypothetical protein
MTQILRLICRTVVALGLLIGAARPTQAAIIMTMEEVAGDVVVKGSGTADLTALLIAIALPQGAAVHATEGSIVLGPDPLITLADQRQLDLPADDN